MLITRDSAHLLQKILTMQHVQSLRAEAPKAVSKFDLIYCQHTNIHGVLEGEMSEHLCEANSSTSDETPTTSDAPSSHYTNDGMMNTCEHDSCHFTHTSHTHLAFVACGAAMRNNTCGASGNM